MKGKQNEVKGHRTIVSIAAVLVVAVMLFPAIGFAADTSYQATTDVAGNKIDTDYFSASLYSDSGCSTEISSFISHEKLQLKHSGTSPNVTYYVNDDTEMTLNPFYLVLDGENHSGDGYMLSVQWGCSMDQTTIPGAVLSVYVGSEVIVADNENDDSDTPGEIQISADTVYTIHMSASDVSANLSQMPTKLNVDITIKIVDSNKADYVDGAEILFEMSARDLMASLNDGSDGGAIFNVVDGPSPGLDPTKPNYDRTYSLMDVPSDYSGIGEAGMLIAGNNDGGVSKSDSSSDEFVINFKIPSGKRFIIMLMTDGDRDSCHAEVTCNVGDINHAYRLDTFRAIKNTQVYLYPTYDPFDESHASSRSMSTAMYNPPEVNKWFYSTGDVHVFFMTVAALTWLPICIFSWMKIRRSRHNNYNQNVGSFYQ